MSLDNNIDTFSSIEEFDEIGKPIEEAQSADRAPANKEQFEGTLQQKAAEAQKVQEVSSAQNSSLLDAVRDMNYGNRSFGQANADTLIAQTKEAISKIDEIKGVLESPNVNIKSSAQQLLQNKLSHIDESLRVAFSRAGVEFNPSVQVEPHKTAANPIERFLGFLTDGQWKLEQLGNELGYMGQTNKELTPVNLLAIQVKVGQIQQELELFSSLLNKGLESIKTIMNIQV